MKRLQNLKALRKEGQNLAGDMEYAADVKSTEQQKDKFGKSKDALGVMRGAKFKSREGNTSGRMQKGASIEMYYSINRNKEREKLVTATENSNEKEIIEQNSLKRSRDHNGHENEQDGEYLMGNGQRSDGANNFERGVMQKGKCTVIIGWKDWYAFESEDDEENTNALYNKRIQRSMPERACCQVQNGCSPLCMVWGPVCSNRERLKSEEIEALSDIIPKQPVLQDGDSDPVPLDSSFERHSVNYRSLMLIHTEKTETLSLSHAAEKDLHRELGTLTFSGRSPGQSGTPMNACSSLGEPGILTTARENTLILVSNCQETVASAPAKQTFVIDSRNCTSQGFANIKERKTVSLEKVGLILFAMEATTGKALPLDEIEREFSAGLGGKILRKKRSKRLRKIGGVFVERGTSADSTVQSCHSQQYTLTNPHPLPLKDNSLSLSGKRSMGRNPQIVQML